jgi:hypothetical protein
MEAKQMPPVIVPLVANALIAFGVAPLTALSIGISVGTGAFLSSIGTIALSVGLSAAANAISRASMSDKGKLGGGVNSTDLRLNTRQEVPPKRWIYGEVLVGGPLFFEESIGKKYYQGFLWSEGPISEVVRIQNSQNRIPFNMTWDAIMTPSTDIVGAPPYAAHVRASIRQGLISQAIDPLLAAAFAALNASTFRQRGVATIVFEADSAATFDLFEELWGTVRRPNPIALVRGVPLYDPRNPACVLPNDPNDPAELEAARLTWPWSNTAALVQADYLWRADGGRIPLGSMRWDEIAKSATYDEGLIGTADGSLIKRHTIDGIVNANLNPLSIIQSMLTANRGFVARHQGKVWVQSSQPIVDPVMTITDATIKGSIEIRRAQPKRQLLNRVRTRFIDPRQEWMQVDGPIRDRPDWQAADGDLYEASLDLLWTADQRRAQRLAKIALDESRLGKLITTALDVETVGLKAGDVVRVESEIVPRANGIYRLTEVGLADGMSALRISGVEYDHTIESSWNPAVDELPFELPDLEVS